MLTFTITFQYAYIWEIKRLKPFSLLLKAPCCWKAGKVLAKSWGECTICWIYEWDHFFILVKVMSWKATLWDLTLVLSRVWKTLRESPYLAHGWLWICWTSTLNCCHLNVLHPWTAFCSNLHVTLRYYSIRIAETAPHKDRDAESVKRASVRHICLSGHTTVCIND